MHASSLRYLIKVAEFGSIRRAADALNVASSAVNRQILNIERDIGVSLFERTVKGVRPTAAGELMLQHARDTLGGYQRVVDEIACQAGDIRGGVRIIGIGSMIEFALPQVMVEVAKRYPGISFHIGDANPGDAVEGLKTQKYDIGIFFLDHRHRDFELLASVRTSIGAVMRADHPLAGRQHVTLTECAGHTVAMFSDRWVIMPLVEAEFQQTGAQFSPRVVTNSMTIMRAAIHNGLGIGFFTPVGFMDDIRAGKIAYVPLEARQLPASGIGLFLSRSALASPPVRVVADHLAEFFKRLQLELDGLRTGGRLEASRTSLPGAHAP
ncbi:MAG: LysR family transcriptional regulator [Rhizobiales bacterium]|nr:LysR family transcriptional regulator [Hyphomicrobiales bacterium]